MSAKKVVSKGKSYKGSKANGGRKIVVYHYKDSSGNWRTTSKNAARAKYEKKHGTLSKDTDVDHSDNNKDNDSSSNLKAMSHSKNVGKENKRRSKSKKKKKKRGK